MKSGGIINNIKFESEWCENIYEYRLKKLKLKITKFTSKKSKKIRKKPINGSISADFGQIFCKRILKGQ
jgi:hypothetical protein